VYPLACNNLAKDAEIIPLPKDDVTPPVTKMYFAETAINEMNCNYGAQS
jgi:hypothetical protein